MAIEQIEEEKMGVNAQMKNRINSMPRGQKPNIMAHAIGTAASAYAAEADITGKNLFTGKALAKTMPNYVIPTTSGFSGLTGNSPAFPSVFNQ